MSTDILRELASVGLFAGFMGLVLAAILKNPRTRFDDDAARLPIGSRRPFGHGEEGR
jgi:hypothetical protein